jgi:hypothetical protein
MSAKEDGGPAFPQSEYPHMGQVGMSLRDYFAAKAMAAFIASGECDVILSVSDSDWPETIAREAYDAADAMLKARKS